MTKRLLGMLAIAATTLCPATVSAKQGGVVTINGRVGPVQVGQSTAAQVRSRIGRPVSSKRVQTSAAATKYLQLTYGCGNGKETYFFFDGKGHLSNFVTSCQSWRTLAGTRIGDGYDEASEAEGKTPETPGCGDGMVITKRGKSTLHVTFDAEDEPVSILAIEGSNNVLGC